MKRKQIFLLPIFLLMLLLAFAAPVAAETTGCVVDETGLLAAADFEELNSWAATLGAENQCGFYGYIVNDYRFYSDESVSEAAKSLYLRDNLGVGTERNGVLLLLSMAERDYALIVYGESAQEVFTASAQDDLTATFLDDFDNDDWYGGFSNYLENAGAMTAAAATGTAYVGEDEGFSVGSLFLILPVPCAVAFGVCMVLKRGMKTARKRYVADEYLAGNGAQIYAREDHFSHVTQTRMKIPKSDHNSIGGGFSGKSGKF